MAEDPVPLAQPPVRGCPAGSTADRMVRGNVPVDALCDACGTCASGWTPDAAPWRSTGRSGDVCSFQKRIPDRLLRHLIRPTIPGSRRIPPTGTILRVPCSPHQCPRSVWAAPYTSEPSRDTMTTGGPVRWQTERIISPVLRNRRKKIGAVAPIVSSPCPVRSRQSDLQPGRPPLSEAGCRVTRIRMPTPSGCGVRMN